MNLLTPTRVRPAVAEQLPAATRDFLARVVTLGLIEARQCEAFLAERGGRLRDLTTPERLGGALIQARLINRYQLERLLTGATNGLVLGSYRVLEELGQGGMGVVYLAEHRLMRRRVAVKVVPVEDDTPPALLERFYAEMRVLAELSHPNIVMALDAGDLPARPPHAGLIYLVMEVVEGGDLERRVLSRGLMSVAEACHAVRQAAAGLQAAHDRHLVHRDVKPSNLLQTATGQVKLVDFGLARQFSSRLTDPRALLGSVEFMPPEQSHDPSSVGKEADVYGLGATLFWLLTGEGPYPATPHVGQALRQLQERPPRLLRSLCPEAPPELEAVVASMLHRDPARRPASPLAVADALRPFVGPAAPSVPLGGEADQLLAVNRQLESSLQARDADLRDAHNAILFTMAKVAESRDGETPGHLKRMQMYTRVLALEAARAGPPWRGLVDDRFLDQLHRCVPLHDIGKIGLPDDILLKPASLTPAERALVETHPLIGDRILESLAREHGSSLDFLGTARAIVRHHHERYDGTGYPDRLLADAIPPAARVVAVADVYDALRRTRLYKPAMPHRAAVRLMLERSQGQFDPELAEALARCHGEWERIYDSCED